MSLFEDHQPSQWVDVGLVKPSNPCFLYCVTTASTFAQLRSIPSVCSEIDVQSLNLKMPCRTRLSPRSSCRSVRHCWHWGIRRRVPKQYSTKQGRPHSFPDLQVFFAKNCMLHYIKFRAMNCDITTWLDCDSSSAGVLKEVPRWLEEIEQNLSRFRPESEISRLNRRVDEWVEVSDLLLANIIAVKRGAHQTRGFFNPLILDNLLRLGYDRSFECISKDGPSIEGETTFIPSCDEI